MGSYRDSLPSSGGGLPFPKLAPDLTRATADASAAVNVGLVGEQLILSLTGKFAVSALVLATGNGWPPGTFKVKMVVDDEIIWNADVVSAGGSLIYFRLYGAATQGGLAANTAVPQEHPFICESSLKFYVNLAATNTSTMQLRYNVRPIK